MTSSGNFGFLEQHFPLLAELGQTAEKLYPFDPSSCVLKLRLLAEALTREMAARLGVHLGQATQAELLRAVDSRLGLVPQVRQMFHRMLPSAAEQTEIVRRVYTLFAFAGRLEARLQIAQIAANRLTPSLPAKAFRGELVAQDPNVEPASGLLKRLSQANASPPARWRGRSAMAA